MQTKINDILLSITSITSLEILNVFANASEIITTGCQLAIAAATVYRLIKDNQKK